MVLCFTGQALKLAAIYNPDEAALDFHCSGCSTLIWQGKK